MLGKQQQQQQLPQQQQQRDTLRICTRHNKASFNLVRAIFLNEP
jgi:hypothetical protein